MRWTRAGMTTHHLTKTSARSRSAIGRVRRLGFGAMRITGPGIWGPPPDHDGAHRGPAARGGARRQPDRHRRLVRAECQRGADRRGPPSLSGGPADRHQGRADSDRSGPWPAAMGARSTCGRPARARSGGCGSTPSSSTSTTAPIRRCPTRISIGALKELQDEGKIRHIGVSNVSLDQLETAREIVEVVSVQNRFNLIDRHSQDVLERCEELGIAFFPWAPIAAGELAEPGGPVDRIASRHDASPGQVALAWLLAHSRRHRCRSQAPHPSSTSSRTSGRPRCASPQDELAELESASAEERKRPGPRRPGLSSLLIEVAALCLRGRFPSGRPGRRSR